MKPHEMLWSSVSILTGAVLAVFALAPEAWREELCLLAFAVWGIWLLLALSRRGGRHRPFRRRRNVPRSQGARGTVPCGTTETYMEELLIRHVNCRISAYLHTAYPEAKWEWATDSPGKLILHGGVGRILLHGVPDYHYAEVEIQPSGSIRCNLLRLDPFPKEAPGNAQEEAESEPLSPRVWFELQGRQVLERTLPDLISRGYSSLTINEDGTIAVKDEQGGRAIQRFSGIPKRDRWPELVRVLEGEGYAASEDGNGITMTW